MSVFIAIFGMRVVLKSLWELLYLCFYALKSCYGLNIFSLGRFRIVSMIDISCALRESMGNSTTKIELKMVRYYNHQMKYMLAITLEEMFGCFCYFSFK